MFWILTYNQNNYKNIEYSTVNSKHLLFFFFKEFINGQSGCIEITRMPFGWADATGNFGSGLKITKGLLNLEGSHKDLTKCHKQGVQENVGDIHMTAFPTRLGQKTKKAVWLGGV